MSPIKVNVKWSGKKFDDLELDPTESVLTFKTQLFSVTGVEPERQKILTKGGVLKDDTDLASLNLKDGHTFMMMGTAGELPKAPEKKVMFMEDMSDAQLYKAYDIPGGLENLGNTCYLNATLQCLRAVPELRERLDKFSGRAGQTADPSASLTAALRDLYKDLDTHPDGFAPLVFVQKLRNMHPKFAQIDNQTKMYSQQDAEECWTELVSALRSQLTNGSGAGQSDRSVIEQYMSGEMAVKLSCDDNSEEPSTIKTEPFFKLNCHIDRETNYLSTGLKAALTEKLTKRSPSLDRDADYTRTSTITRLPAYLMVSFIRFFWKADNAVQAKILRKVKFPMSLDMTEFCAPELQEKLRPAKEYLREVDEQKTAVAKRNKRAKLEAADTTMQVDGSESTGDHKEGKETSTTDNLKLPNVPELDPSLKEDPGCNPSGQYELCAVLTHQGRATNSGHYIAWVRKRDSDDWFKFDDDKVSMVKEADIEKLSGGGDWHTAYICLYRAKKFP
ncbi:deubiquitinating enzyme [Dispira simplex]|nr:deubiquitinating enzyme [Dispira simplex]